MCEAAQLARSVFRLLFAAARTAPSHTHTLTLSHIVCSVRIMQLHIPHACMFIVITAALFYRAVSPV